MRLSALIHGSVLTLALSSVSMMGAGIAGAVLIKIMGWRHNAVTLCCTIAVGLFAAAAWTYAGLSSTVNESGIGAACGIVTNWLLTKWSFDFKHP
jgi:hypothetical protein